MRTLTFSTITLLASTFAAACSSVAPPEPGAEGFDTSAPGGAATPGVNPYCGPGLIVEQFDPAPPLTKLLVGWEDGPFVDPEYGQEYGAVLSAEELRLDARTGVGLIRGSDENNKRFQLGVYRTTLGQLRATYSGLTPTSGALIPGEFDIQAELKAANYKDPAGMELAVYGSLMEECPTSAPVANLCPGSGADVLGKLYVTPIDANGKSVAAANLRIGPSTASPGYKTEFGNENNIIGTLGYGTAVSVLETVELGGKTWAKVQTLNTSLTPNFYTVHGNWIGGQEDGTYAQVAPVFGYIRADFLSAFLTGVPGGPADSMYSGVTVENGIASAESLLVVRDAFGTLPLAECQSAKRTDGSDVRFYNLTNASSCDATGECEVDTIHVTSIKESSFVRPSWASELVVSKAARFKER